MSRHRILLMCSQQLFGESMEEILRLHADMDLIGTCGFDENIHQHIAESRPDVVVLIGVDSQSDEMIRLTSAIIEQHPEVVCPGTRVCTSESANAFEFLCKP